MLRILSAELWSTITKLAKTGRKQAAVAYVTSDRHVAFGQGDVLVTDASDKAISGGQTAAKVLAAAHARDAKLYSLPDLHAKVMCLSRFAVVGSTNISSLSVTGLVEAAIVTDQPGVLAEARALIAQLVEIATPIDDAFIERISAIPVVRTPIRRGKLKPRLKERVSRTWVVGVHQINEQRFADEAEWVEEGEREADAKIENDDSTVSWIRFTGASSFRRDAQPGDTLLQIWRKKSKSKTARVLYPAPIVHRQDEPTCTRFYVESFVDEDERALAWKDFVAMWGRATDTEPPPLACARLLTSEVATRLIALWPS